MKKVILSLFVAFMATVAIQAQQIAVVTENGETTLFKTLDDAIKGAEPGSVIYLPGGGFPVSDETTITKKLTIIGIGHKVNGENADGYTTITGNLYFNEGSNNSAVMGAYITGDVFIGNDGKRVNDITVRYCNLRRVQVKNSACLGTVVNQNYIRSSSIFNGAPGEFSNNVAYAVRDLNNGFIEYNVLLSRGAGSTGDIAGVCECKNSSITNNLFYERYGCTDSSFDNNIMEASFHEDEFAISYSGKWEDLFEKYPANLSSVSINSNNSYHFKGDFKQYDGQIGIFGGSSFDTNSLPPVPFITFKEVADKTDAAGKLKINVRAKANN